MPEPRPLYWLLSAAPAAIGALSLLRWERSWGLAAFFSGMMLIALEGIFGGLCSGAKQALELSRWVFPYWLVTSLNPGVWLLFSLGLARPKGSRSIRDWALGISGLIPFVASLILYSHLLPLESVIDAFSARFVPFTGMASAFQIVLLIEWIITLANLERALRASVGRTRWKVKYLVFGLGLWCAYKIYSGGQALLFHGLELEGLVLGSWAGCGASAFLLVGVLRSGGTQIQLPLSHWALYQSATLILVGAYFLLVGVIAQILKLVGALSEVHYVAALTLFAMGGLAVILFSDRVRYAIRRFISHHFKATVHDYRSIWTKFSQRTSSSIDEKSLCAESVRFLSETLEALSVSLWVKVPDQNRMKLAASTVMDRNQARDFPLNGMEAGEFLDLLCKEAHPVVDLETHNKEAMRTWKEANREFLAQAKARYLAPLIAGGESLGLIALGERVRWAPMSFEDMELMRTLADHTAKSLRQLRLLEEVRRSRELEAFQAMSAFLVHDLKNLSSKLALVAQNLPEFYEEEEFRRDALRVMTQCVDKIKAMCQQLTFMRQGLNPVCKPLDLNSLVEEVLTELNGLLAARVELQKENSVTVSADPELLKRVLSNLILNSHEATEGRGKILIKTFRGADGWVGFSVEDDGPGMSQEFMDQCLFRPFRTTKSKGMGIGLFQCKSIVEAHQGRIEVESSPAKGTKVKVLLPQKTRANRQGMETAPM